MSDNSRIQWTQATWSPVTGCDRVSSGCDLCYALTLAKRLKAMGSPKYQNDGDPRTSGPGFGVTVHEDALQLPLKWKKPRRIFVNSMSDLFHDEVPDEFIARVWAVMAATPQHTYQILTKRHARMRSFLQDACRCGAGHPAGVHLMSAMSWAATRGNPNWVPGLDSEVVHEATRGFSWGKVLPNVHVGVSVENQKWADIRIPALRETPGAVRMLSCEPLLGPLEDIDLDGIGWCIIGGESGKGARPMELAWAEDLVEQCRAAKVPVFMKQLGSRWGKNHHDIDAFPESLRVREYPVTDLAGVVR